MLSKHASRESALQTKLLFLVDGLDEFEGSEEQREDLIDYLVSLSRHRNSKLILSSRPWNIFTEAFQKHPQLRLEDLTYNDITTFVSSKLRNHRLFQYLERHDSIRGEHLIGSIITKAAGVFLWVRLVIRDILKCIRDGDGLAELQQRLDYIPADLDDYFVRMIESIEPDHRREASVLLQLALHKEAYFTAVHPLRLMDISFVGGQHEDFATKPGYDFNCVNFLDRDSLLKRIFSTLRKLNSRCMGMLECTDHGTNLLSRYDLNIDDQAAAFEESQKAALPTGPRTGVEPPPLAARSHRNLRSGSFDVSPRHGDPDLADIRKILGFEVKFLHRSLHDFLMTPDMQAFLHQYTGGPFNVRTYLCNARLVEFNAVTAAAIGQDCTAWLASYLLCALSVDHESSSTVTTANIMRSSLSKLAEHYEFDAQDVLYLDSSLINWQVEESSFLTLAIDFNLTAFVLANLSSHTIQTKGGRPILDYILRPRFAPIEGDIDVTNRWPNMALLDAALGLGADPNESYRGTSVWALSLCFCADVRGAVCRGCHYAKIQIAYYQALLRMVRAGAAPLVTRSSLSALVPLNSFGGWSNLDFQEAHETDDNRFKRRWTKALPSISTDQSQCDQPLYAVSDLLRDFVDIFDFSIEPLMHELRSKEPSRTRMTTGPLFFEIPADINQH